MATPSRRVFIAWYSGNPYERFTFPESPGASGPYWWAYGDHDHCNVAIPQLFWFKCMRTNLSVMFVIRSTNIGMWFERLAVIINRYQSDRDFRAEFIGAMFHPT